MDTAVLATAITAVGGILVAYIAASRVRKQDSAVNELARHTDLISGYAKIVADLQNEIARIRADYREDLAAIEQDRAKLVVHVSDLEAELQKLKRTVKRNGRAR